jgi:hypothetical protein
MYLRRFVHRQLTCLRTESRALWLHAHSRQSIPTQTGMTTTGEAWRQNTTLATAARDCQPLANIVPTHGRSLTAPCELGPPKSTFCHPTGVTASHPFGTCLSVVIYQGNRLYVLLYVLGLKTSVLPTSIWHSQMCTRRDTDICQSNLTPAGAAS